MPIRVDPPEHLEPDQRGVFDRLVNIVSSPGADRAYDGLEGAKRGKIISVDVARLLAPEFASWDGRLRHTPSTANPAGAYAHNRLTRELARRRRARKRLLITAGGAGSGKTSMLKGQTAVFDLVFDNQLRNLARARSLLLAALRHGWEVEVVYVHRPFEDVIRAVIDRSQRTGRWNRLADLPGAHIESQRTVVALRREFRGRAWVHATYNASPGAGDRSPASIVLIRELAPGGRYHLSDAKSLLKTIPPVLEKAKAEGIVSAQVAALVAEGLATA
jgi:hypothetical protein